LAHEPGPVEPPREHAPDIAPQPATQDNSPPAPELETKIEPKTIEPAVPAAKPAEPVPAPVVSAPEPLPAATPEPPPPAAPAPLFRARSDLGRPAAGKPPIAPVPAVIPILRAPDDPGIDDEAPVDEFTEKIGTPRAQAGGWRGFWSRWGG
jgi:HemY protein